MDILFVEDSPERFKTFKRIVINHSITHAINASDALEALSKQSFDIIMLDHDLEEEHYKQYDPNADGTGASVVKTILETPEKYKKTVFIIHSLNPDGGKRMFEMLRGAGFEAHHLPFAWQNKYMLKVFGLCV